MGSTQAFAFVVLALAFALLAALTLLRTGLLRLESPLGRARDGPADGTAAPRWRLADLEGRLRQAPSGSRWQLLIFADHSLRAFPELAEAIGELCAREPELEAVLLARSSPDLTARTAAELGLVVPVVPVDREFYWRHRVRAMPFVIVLDPTGLVRGRGLVSDRAGLALVWQLSRAPARPGWRPGRLSAAGRWREER